MVVKHILFLFATIILAEAAGLKKIETDADSTWPITESSTTEPIFDSTTVIPTTTTESPKDEASAIYNELDKKVRTAIKQSERSLKQITWSAISFSSNGTKNIEETYLKFLGEFYSLKEAFAKLGTDISECIKHVEPTFAKQKRYLLDQLSRAVVHEVDVMYNYYVFDTLRGLSNISLTVHDLGSDLRRCGIDMVCIRHVQINLEKQSDIVSAKIDKYLSQLKQYQTTYTKYAEKAIDSELTKFKIDGTTALESVRACAEKLITV